MAGVTIDIPGIGNVEAKNAASEATLQEILKVMKANGAAGKGGGQSTAKQNLNQTQDAGQGASAGAASKFGKALGQAVYSSGKFAGATVAATKSLVGFGASATGLISDLANVGDSLTAAAGTFSAIPIVGGPLSSIFTAVAGAVEKSTGAFQSAAKSGATFGGSINTFAASASAAGMTMDKFGALISKNADSMVILGGTTESGAKRFAELTKQIRSSGVGTELYNLGYTTEEVNSGMASYIKQMGNTGKLQGKSTSEIAAASGKYLKELDGLAKITGETREEKMKEQEALQKDAQFRAATANLEPDQKEMLQNFITSFPKAQQAAVKDMIATGSITSDAASKMNTQMGAASAQIMQYGQIIKQGGKLSQQQLDGTYKSAVLEAKARAKTAEFQTIGSYAYSEFGDAILGVADLAARDADGKVKAMSEQEKAAKGSAAVQEQAKQRLAELSNSFTMVLANSGLLDKMMKAFEMLSGFVSNYVVPIFNVLSTVIGAAIDGLSVLITPIMEIASSLMSKLQPAFYAIGDFIQDNLVPIMIGVGTALAVTLAPAVVALAAAALTSAASMIAAVLPIAAPFIAIAATVGAAVAIFKKMGGDVKVAGDSLKWLGLTFKSVFLKIKEGFFTLLNKIPGMRGDFDEDLKEIAKEQEAATEDKAKLEKEMSTRMEENRKKNAEEDAKKAKEREKRDAGLAKKSDERDKKLHDEKAARAKASETGDTEVKKDYSDPENLLKQELTQQRGKEIEKITKEKEKTAKTSDPSREKETGQPVAKAESAKPKEKAQTASTAEAPRKEMEKKADEDTKQKQAEAENKKIKEEAEKKAIDKEKQKEPTTQESAETLLASLNSKMEQLIKINKLSVDVNERQLTVQQGMSGDLYAGV
jgi:hypothetical protein